LNGDELIDTFSSFTLFADLSRPQLEALAHIFEEEWFAEGQRVVHQGFGGVGFYVILHGEAAVRIDGVERARLGRGEFFGELSILLDEPPAADVMAITPLEDFLLAHPTVSLRMLQVELRRLRASNQWRA
jgi:CRP-like cAMP-binding protein